MFCNKCGKELPDGARFCSGCGNDMGRAGKQESSVASTSSQEVKQDANVKAQTSSDYREVPTAGSDFPVAAVQAASASPATIQEKKVDFSISLLFFWVKGHMSADYRFVKIETANTVLGVIPAGSDNRSIPLNQISDASINTSYSGGAMFIGAMLVLMGLSFMNGNGSAAGVGIIIAAIGVVLIAGGVKTRLCIQRAGNDYNVFVPFYEKNKMVEMAEVINSAIAVSVDKTDNFILANTLTNAMKDGR